ncbi:DUF2388 domain-containing protein [Lysobacter humi (ex Lee et al. 2017)]
MTRLAPLLLGLALTLACTHAAASSFGGTTGGATANGASNTSGSTSGDDKVVAEARDDAALFVATDGRVRGARLEAALRLLRERHSGAREADDLQLAQAILAR